MQLKLNTDHCGNFWHFLIVYNIKILRIHIILGIHVIRMQSQTGSEIISKIILLFRQSCKE